MKIALVSTIGAALILLISFQNCQKPPYADEINSQVLNAIGSSGSDYNKVDLNQEAVDSINFLIQDSQIVSRAGKTYQINYNKTLQINLKTGNILESSDLSGETAHYCLTEALKNELIAILKSSQVCKKQQNSPAGSVCTQVMKLPYAQVMTSREQFDLGSASDGCGNNSIDLCESQPDLLKGYIEAIKKQYQQLVCPP